MITTNAKIAWAKFMHNNSVYERQVRNGYKPVTYPSQSLVMCNGVRSLAYVHNSQRILERCV